MRLLYSKIGDTNFGIFKDGGQKVTWRNYMDIQTVAINLRNTIAGKEFLLNKMQNGRESMDFVDRSVSKATQSYLKMNIEELKTILADVENCKLGMTNEEFKNDKYA